MCCTPTVRLLIVLTCHPAITVLSTGYRPLGSCSRAAGWSAATSCVGPKAKKPGHAALVRCQGADRTCVSGSSTAGCDPKLTSNRDRFGERSALPVGYFARLGYCPYLTPGRSRLKLAVW